MGTGATRPSVWEGFARNRPFGIVAGVVLCIEALWSPLVWWGAFIVGAFISLGDDTQHASLLDAMDRLGPWGPLVLLVPLFGGAVAVLGRPSRPRVLWAALCLLAAFINLVPAVALIVYNVGFTGGPAGPRLAGVAFGAAFGVVAARMLADGVSFLRRPPAEPAPPAMPTGAVV